MYRDLEFFVQVISCHEDTTNIDSEGLPVTGTSLWVSPWYKTVTYYLTEALMMQKREEALLKLKGWVNFGRESQRLVSLRISGKW